METDRFTFILCTGGRNWKDEATIRNVLSNLLRNNVFVVHGDCKSGADALVDLNCDILGISRIKMPANWTRLHKAAGPIRNRWMLQIFNPKLVIAFHENLDESKGTKNTVKEAQARSIPVLLITGPMDEFDLRFDILRDL